MEVASIVIVALCLAFCGLLMWWTRREAAGITKRAETELRAAQSRTDELRRDQEAAAEDRDAARQTLETTRLDRQAAEQERSAAEQDRHRAEQERHAAEHDRRTAEQERSAAEHDRREAEQERHTAQQIREQAAGMTAAEAITSLRTEYENTARLAVESSIRRQEENLRSAATQRARRILTESMQRCARPVSATAAVTIMELPSEEMKGRIIGKEGRNIRTFEALTGVNLIVDDTPNQVVLSSFDPERRELAATTLADLVADGRIQPGRIEAAYTRAVAGSQERNQAEGAAACLQAEVGGLDPEIVQVLGRLRLRVSFGQNVLAHLVECAQLAAMIAAEVGADVAIARRAAFLHDLGKGLGSEYGASHARAGARFAEQHGEAAVVVNAIAAHHEEVAPESVEAVIVQVVDTCSAARPGARRDELAQYVDRMDRLEKFVAEHAGVNRVLAMAAGREVRVVVEPEEVDDAGTAQLARTIASSLEAELSYPGEIKVIVVRETRAEAVAG